MWFQRPTTSRPPISSDSSSALSSHVAPRKRFTVAIAPPQQQQRSTIASSSSQQHSTTMHLSSPPPPTTTAAAAASVGFSHCDEAAGADVDRVHDDDGAAADRCSAPYTTRDETCYHRGSSSSSSSSKGVGGFPPSSSSCVVPLSDDVIDFQALPSFRAGAATAEVGGGSIGELWRSAAVITRDLFCVPSSSSVSSSCFHESDAHPRHSESREQKKDTLLLRPQRRRHVQVHAATVALLQSSARKRLDRTLQELNPAPHHADGCGSFSSNRKRIRSHSKEQGQTQQRLLAAAAVDMAEDDDPLSDWIWATSY